MYMSINPPKNHPLMFICTSSLKSNAWESFWSAGARGTPIVSPESIRLSRRQWVSLRRRKISNRMLVGIDDLGYPNALVQTNNSSSRALMQPPSSHERGRDEDASAARARRGGVHQSNCAQDVRMHDPELPGSSWPRGRTNPFPGHAESTCKGEVLRRK